MVIGPDFVWSHMPKTGGTSTKRMFDIVCGERPDMYMDHGIHNINKHDNITIKDSKVNLGLNTKHRIMGFRQLPTWIISIAYSSAAVIPVTSYAILNGIVRTIYPVTDADFGLDGGADCRIVEEKQHFKQHTPDSLLTHFMCGRVDSWLRMEKLSSDFISVAGQFVSISGQQKEEIQNTYLHQREYDRRVRRWFRSKRSMKQVYDLNPVWAQLEYELYGSLMSDKSTSWDATSRREARPVGARACTKFVS